MPRLVPLAAPMALACAALAASPAHADTLLSVEPSAPKVTAAGGAAAWSTFDATAGAWFLVIRQGGAMERAAIAPRSVPFDVDLGRDAAGRLVAAYSRCDRDPDIAAPLGRGCDLYAYDLASRRERLLPGPSTDEASEYMPSLAAGRVAFARVHERRRGAAGVRTAVYVRRLDRGPAKRLPGGTLNDDDRTGVTGLDLDARQLAISWRTAGPAGPGIPYGTAELRIDRLDGSEQTMVIQLVGTYLDYGGVVTPALAGGRVRYGLIWVNEGGTTIGDVAEYDLARGTRTSLRLPDRVAGVAVSGRDTYVVRCNPEWMLRPGCDVSVRETAGGADPDTELARSTRATPVSGYRGWVAYSVYDPPAGYRLTLRSAQGVLVQPPVPARPAAFDVDLGPGRDGSLAAVYSRCRRRDCDVYRYDTTRRREVRVTHTAASEFLPAIDGSRIVFARRDRRGRTTIESLAGERLAGPARARPRAIDLRGRRVAVLWDRRVRLLAPGRDRVLASGADLRAVAFDGNGVAWVGRGRGRTLAVRVDLASGARRSLVLPRSATAYVPWNTWDGRSGSYGRTDAAGWSLRTPLMLPELLR